MSQNKSVEEVVDNVVKAIAHCISTSSPQNFTNVKNKITQAIQQERQTSQEREREIVGAILEALNGMAVGASPEFKAGYDLAIVDAIERVKFVTNPNKD